MSDTLSIIQQPIKDHLDRFESFFANSISSESRIMGAMIGHVLGSRGKQMRPMLVFLSAALHGEINESTYIGGSLIEMLHSATLIHDDVIDEAYQRRGRWSFNTLWRSKKSVLMGDFLLAKAMKMAAETDNFHIIKEVTASLPEMTEGEIVQMVYSQKLNITEEAYYDIIHRKTATLLASAAAVGAISVGADSEGVATIRRFGEQLGMAFQIKDDILDYTKKGLTGKTPCNDLKERKITLPLLYVLGNADSSTRRKMLSNIRNLRIEVVRDFVLNNGGIEYAESKMQGFYNEAIAELDAYADGPVKNSLTLFAQYVMNRKK